MIVDGTEKPLVHDQDTFWAMDREALRALTKDVVVRSANS